LNTTQSVLNIGTLGHIDHGKTSLTRAITGVWTDKHSESLKRNMTIKLGYADAIIRKCPQCTGTDAYTTAKTCTIHDVPTDELMHISMLDAPGHETLMATAIAGSSVIDGILFVIAANEPCPMQQTREHLMIIEILGVKNVVIVQSKIDIVGREAAEAHYKQIKEFIKNSPIRDAPIIPVMTNQNINVDAVLERIAGMQIPKRDLEAQPLMYVVRSFDVNRPNIDASGLVGGVIGGAIIQGRFRVGDEIEIRPGIKIGDRSKKDTYTPIVTVITSMSNGSNALTEAIPGGLIGVSTEIDPAFAKADGLMGNVVGHVGKLPETRSDITMTYVKLDRKDIPEQGLREGEPLILGVATATTVGAVRRVRKSALEIELKRPVCALKGAKVAVMRNISQRWRLTGYGILQ
jgi:translation initiation factor 2 subunit 3